MPFVEETILSPMRIPGTVGLQPPPELARYNVKLPPKLGRQEGNLRKKADHSRLVGGEFTKQGKSPMRLCFDGCETSNFLHPPTQSSSLYRGFDWSQSCTQEALTRFSQIPSLDSSITTLLSQGHVLGKLLEWGRQAESTFHARGESGKAPMVWV